jgi:chromosome segregation ATPase
MCSVNDQKRTNVQNEIIALEAEQTANQALIDDATDRLAENNAAVTEANCAVGELEHMNLGSDSIMNSVNNCLTDLNYRIETLDTILREAEAVKTKIAGDITAKQAEYDAIPENCGTCPECDPPDPPWWWYNPLG